MKKSIIFFIVFLFPGLVAINAQDFISVSGHVTDETSGDPIPGHEVNISADSAYSSTVLTNEAGFYADTIRANHSVGFVYISTPDNCSYLFHDTTIYNPAQGTAIIADFEICDSAGNNCQADFNYHADSSNSFLIHFTDQSTPAEAIDSWFWEFGDGITSAEQNPSHEYNSHGYHHVCLTIESDSGACSDTYCQYIYVYNGSGGECQADFTYHADSSNPHLIYFTDLSTPEGNIDRWFWDFGDSTASEEQNPEHVFGDAGTYNVCLTIHSTVDSCMDTYCGEVVVGNPAACQADFYYHADSTNPHEIYFHDQSTPAEAIYAWYWDFDDGTTSNEQNPLHTYNAPGTYNVCLSIHAAIGDDTCTSTYCMDVVVQGGPMNLHLGGNVFADIYQLDHGFAYAYKYENGAFTEVYSQMVDTLGYYLFYPLTESNYYTKAEPTPNSAYYDNYLPTYYGDATHWEVAEMISLNQNIFTADINLVEIIVTTPGAGMIKGQIFYEDVNKDDSPANNIQIMLTNEDGDYIGLNYSDEEGSFEFTELANGTYTLYAEVMGKTMIPRNFTIDDENQVVDDIVMIIGETNIVFGIDEISSKYIENISSIYPNPVNNTLRFDVELKETSQLQVNVISLTGQYINRNKIDLNQTGTVEINTDQLNPGMYVLEIITEDQYKISKRFIRY